VLTLGARLRRLAVASVVALVLFVAAGSAHDLERTQVHLSFDTSGAFVLDIANDPSWLLLRLESFAGGNVPAGVTAAARDRRLRTLGEVFIDRVVLFVDGHEVRPQSAEYIPARPQTATDALPPLATFRLRGQMPHDAKTLRWLYGLVIDPYPLTVRRADGAVKTEWIQGSNWSGVLDLSGQFRRASRWDVMREYLALGYTHILPKGLDHILFVLGLFLLSIRVRPILIQVTTFTIAHSITLGLTIFGVLALPASVVEPLIALSIAYVAVENLVTSELKPWRLALVFLFGLLHGMGFAGVLTDLGLPREEFLAALLSFNAGVEGGQLTVVALATLCVFAYRHHAWYHQRVVVPASVLIASIGVYWTIVRLLP
jgi:hypothetical protein